MDFDFKELQDAKARAFIIFDGIFHYIRKHYWQQGEYRRETNIFNDPFNIKES